MKKAIFRVGLVIAACLLALLFYWTRPVTAYDATFGGVSLRLEYATTTAVQERGLGGRGKLAPDYGMLFVFATPDRYAFWMKDMLIPIDMFWLDDKRQVVWMEQSVSPDTYPAVFYPPTAASYVLETEAGFAALHSIATGTVLELQNF